MLFQIDLPIAPVGLTEYVTTANIELVSTFSNLFAYVPDPMNLLVSSITTPSIW